MDADIVTSLKNLNEQEKIHGPMHAEFAQLDAKREPLLTWAPKWKGKWDINYFVPNFGADKDIADSKVHTEAEEKRLGHVWTPEKDEDGEWTRIPGVFTLNGRSN